MLRLTVEQGAQGEKRFVHVSRSGRQYRGATPEEAERKTLLAALHALERTLEGRRTTEDEVSIARRLCAAKFGGIYRFGELTVEQMRELRNDFIEALRFGQKMEREQRIEPAATNAQIKRIVKLGRYSIITDTYGVQFLWKKCREWVKRYRNAKRIELSDLTQQEAWYVIQRLERIERRLKGGVDDAD